MPTINLNNLENNFVIAGLGNPGEKYENTRHNAGFLFVDLIAKRLGEVWKEDKKLNCRIIKSGKIILLKPLDYMNNSGRSLEYVLNYYKMLPKKMLMKIKNADLSNTLLVIHDELDIDFGRYKFSTDSRSAGNNGVQSIIDRLKTKNFQRLRIGIKSDLLKHITAKDFVLTRFNGEERECLDGLYKEILDKEFSF